MIKRLGIFASGKGSNAEAIINHFQNYPDLDVGLIVSNRADAGVLHRAAKYRIPAYIHNQDSDTLLQVLRVHQIDAIALAGYLKQIKSLLITAYSDRIVNIHPSLLPDFGGKGMYGLHVHNAVLASGVSETGITIHLVNAEYDQGRILLQEKVQIPSGMSPEQLASEVHQMEHVHYPRFLVSWLRNLPLMQEIHTTDQETVFLEDVDKQKGFPQQQEQGYI